MPTNFDPNNYQEFYQEALKKWEETARSIAAQTTELAKWSAMEQTRDQWFALWQASKFWDTQNYRSKVIWDIEQKSELDRSKMLAEQYAKEQSNSTNQQNLLSTIGSALLQMKLAKEAAAKSGGWGGSSYSPSKISADTLAKLWIGWNATEAVAWKTPTKKEESWFWKVLDRVSPALLVAWAVPSPASPFLLWAWGVLWAAWAVRDVVKWEPAAWAWTVWTNVWAYLWSKATIAKPASSLLKKLFPTFMKVLPKVI